MRYRASGCFVATKKRSPSGAFTQTASREHGGPRVTRQSSIHHPLARFSTLQRHNLSSTHPPVVVEMLSRFAGVVRDFFSSLQEEANHAADLQVQTHERRGLTLDPFPRRTRPER